MKNEKAQEMVRTIEALLKEAKVKATSSTYIDLTLGEGDEMINVSYNRQYHSVLVSMAYFGEFCEPGTSEMLLAKTKAYEAENEELTKLRRQIEDLEKKIAELERP